MKCRYLLSAALCLILSSCQKEPSQDLETVKASLSQAQQELISLRNEVSSKSREIIGLQNQIIDLQQQRASLHIANVRTTDVITRQLDQLSPSAETTGIEQTTHRESLIDLLNTLNSSDHFTESPEEGLCKYVKVLKSELEILALYDSPLDYYRELKIEDTNIRWDESASLEEYLLKSSLARELISLHYRCYLSSHQGYYFTPEELPLLQLGLSNFPGLKALHGEAGYYSADIAKYLLEYRFQLPEPDPERE
ncbi:hypothetical protein Rhal01_01305 [Rubritalea halochordaticola]|uniref:YARHG domain-containing protein n=1 Tax=Rubritalea halochordaticola TaxID=714537 RepID=A0ABP9UY09_9BACT